MTAPISDHAAYNADMSKSLTDKVFFLGKLHALPEDTVFVDFGCGDGSLLKAVGTAYPKSKRWGIDSDPQQCSLAWQWCWAEQSYGDLIGITGGRLGTGPKVAIFSSVLHEAPHLLDHALNGEFDFIVIRDMALSDAHRVWEPQLEYLFKSAYWGTEDWEREKAERYFRLSANAVLDAPPGYSTIHFEHYWLAPLMGQITDRHGYCPVVPTHIKAIWARNA